MVDTKTPAPGARPDTAPADAKPPRVLSAEAQRALAEAEARRQAAAEAATQPAREVGGRDGPDPIRYGDWEKGGIASDF